MNTKNLFGFFLVIASILFLATGAVSAGEITSKAFVQVNDQDVSTHNVSIVAGETIIVEVSFTALVNDSHVRVEAELQGDKVDEEVRSRFFDVEVGQRYKKTLTLRVPYELKNEISDEMTLSIEIDGEDHRTELADITLRVQRPSFNTGILSVNIPSTINAGDLIAIEVVLKNIGYNDLDDLFLTARIPALGAERTTFVGDLFAIEPDNGDDDDEDTIRVRMYLKVPFEAEAGLYTLEVEATNDDLTVSIAKQIAVNNDFENTVIVSEFAKTFGVGESAEYRLLIVNPTDRVKVYRIVTEPSGSLSLVLSETVIAIQPSSSKVVKITATSTTAGEYQFNVNVLSGEKLVSQVTLRANVSGGVASGDAVVVLTVILAIIFLVLLVVLIVLLRKNPEKSEEFGESYY